VVCLSQTLSFNLRYTQTRKQLHDTSYLRTEGTNHAAGGRRVRLAATTLFIEVRLREPVAPAAVAPRFGRGEE
jgi:hypothetical protein